VEWEGGKLTIILRQLHAPISSLLAHLCIDGAGVHVVDSEIGVFGGDGFEEAGFGDHGCSVGADAWGWGGELGWEEVLVLDIYQGRASDERDVLSRDRLQWNGTGLDQTHTNTRRAHRHENRFMIPILRTKRLQERTSRDIAAPDISLERLPILLRIGVRITNRRQRSEIPGVMHQDINAPTIWTSGFQGLKRGGHGGLVEDVGGEGEDLSGGGLGLDGGGDGGEGGGGAAGYADEGGPG
jgi:hypothetical protein